MKTRTEIEDCVLALPHEERTALLLMAVLDCGGDDLTLAIFSLVDCASALTARVSDPLLRVTVARRLRDIVASIEQCDGSEQVVLH